MQDKKELRTLIQQKLKAMKKEEYDSYSERIEKHLSSLSFWREAHTIAITISKENEVNTYHIIQNAWKVGKNVVVPKTYPKTRSMVFFQIKDFADLEVTYFNLKEPIESVCVSVKPQDIDLMIVPGVAFDLKGNRLGYGGGYYDRYLADYDGPTCALAFEKQIVSSIPIEPFDIGVKHIVTEQHVYDC